MERIVARLAGLPLSTINHVRGTHSAAIVDDLLTAGDDVAVEGRQLADELHAVIGGLAGDNRRPRVIGLRRALHRGRRPKRQEWGLDISACMSADLAARITHWIAQLEALAHCPPELINALADDVQRERDLLVKVAAEAPFRAAVRTSSGALDEAIDRWVADPSNAPRDQTVETLARYVARATAKTSPHSTFLASGPVRIDDETGTITHLPHGRAVVLELGTAWAGEAVVAAIASADKVRSRLIARPNPSAVITMNRVDFVGPAPREDLRSLPLNDAVRSCLEAAGTTPHPTYGDLVARLGRELGTTDEVTTFVDHLASAGLISLAPVIQSPDDLAGAAADWLDDGEAAPELVAHLRTLSVATSTAVPTSSITHVDDRRATIAAGLRGVLTATEPQDLPIEPEYVRPERTRDTGVTVGPGVAVRRTWLESISSDLDVIRRWCAPFATGLPLRLAVTELLNVDLGGAAAEYRPIPLLHLHQYVVRRCGVDDAIGRDLTTLARGWPPDDLSSSAFAGVRALAAIRAEALAIFDRPDDGDKQIVIDPDTLTRTAGNYPSWVAELPGMGVDLQPIPESARSSEPSAVINTLAGPYHRNRRRVDWLSAVVGTEPQPREADDDTRPMVADLAGSFGSSLNDHTPGVPFEIDYPFTLSRVPRAERIPVSDLMVGIGDDGLATLFSASHGRQVQPVYLGVMARRYLPPLARLIAEAFTPSPPQSMAATLARAALPNSAAALARQDGVPYRSSRLVVGEVVVRRGAVVIGSDQIPRPRTGDSDAETLLRLRRWHRDAGIPERCFVRLPGDPRVGLISRAWHKPFYLDVTSWSLLRGFSRAMPRSESQRVIFEEALPDPLAPSGLKYATELSVEATKP